LKTELFETRDARLPQGQELRQPEMARISGNPGVFQGLSAAGQGTCGISPVSAENPPMRFHS
jgi:hypothetical protein